MAAKTITLEINAYEKLHAAKKAGESLSEVVCRASFGDALLTGEKLRAYLRSGGSGISESYLDAVEEANKLVAGCVVYRQKEEKGYGGSPTPPM